MQRDATTFLVLFSSSHATVFLSFLFPLVISLTVCSHLFRIAQAGWKGVRTVSEIRREKNIPVPFKKDSDYTKIERVQKVFNPLKIPANLLKELPYASHPKLPKKRKKPTKDDKKYVLLYLMFLLASLFVCVLSMCHLPQRRFTFVVCCIAIRAIFGSVCFILAFIMRVSCSSCQPLCLVTAHFCFSALVSGRCVVFAGRWSARRTRRRESLCCNRPPPSRTRRNASGNNCEFLSPPALLARSLRVHCLVWCVRMSLLRHMDS